MDINNLEKFKAKMALGRMCVGTVITLSDPAVSELAGDAGMDFTWSTRNTRPIPSNPSWGISWLCAEPAAHRWYVSHGTIRCS